MNLLSKISSLFESKRALSLTGDSSSFYKFFFGSYKNRIYGGESLQRLYTRNELAYACINKIADVMNDAEIIVEKLQRNKKTGKDEWTKAENHPLLALIEKPNTEEIGEDLRRKMVQSENFSGICYLRLIRERSSQVPTAIYVLNPNRVFPQIDYSTNKIYEYRYTNLIGQPTTIKPEDILIRRRTDLTDEYFGLAPLAVAANVIDSDENLTDYINALFDNSDDGTGAGIPSGLLTFPKTLSEQQATFKKKLWHMSTKAREIKVLDDTATFQPLGIKPDEMAAESIRWQNEAKICGVFGVPPILVGAYVGLRWSNQRAGVKEALKDFWLNKISPELKVWRKWATWNLLPLFEPIEQIKAGRIRIGYDLKHMLALQEDVDAIHDRARKNLSAGGWTVNEFREATGMIPDPKGDYYLQPFNLEAVSPENRAAVAVQKIEQGTNPNEPVDEPKQLPAFVEKKTEKSYDFDGLILSRKPTEVEKLIGLKSLVSDLESQTENINKSLLKYRQSLINQAVQSVKDLDDTSIHTLTLERNEKLAAKIYDSLTDAFEQGRVQIEREIYAQKQAKNLTYGWSAKKSLAEEIREKLKGASENLINKIINEIQHRTVNIWIALKLLEFDSEEFFDELKKRLFGESDKFVETTSKQAANLAIQAGRKFEIEERSDEWEIVEYSAILDKNLCSECKKWDGKRSKTPDEDFPNVPNPYCEGGSNCRCFWITILD